MSGAHTAWFIDGAMPEPHVGERTKTVAAIPVYNEAATIAGVVLGARRFTDEVIVVDDGSTDGTDRIASQAGARVIRHPRNLGYGAAIRSCLRYARNNGTKTLVILDGDGQHPTDLIPAVLEPVARGMADITIGSRFLDPRAKRKVPPYRRLGIAFLTRLTNIQTGEHPPIRDGQSGFRAYSRRAIELVDPLEADMGAGAEILLEASRVALRVVEVPVEVDYTVGKSRRNPLDHGLSVLGTLVRYALGHHRAAVFGVPGAMSLSIGLAYSSVVLAEFALTTRFFLPGAVAAYGMVFVGAVLAIKSLLGPLKRSVRPVV